MISWQNAHLYKLKDHKYIENRQRPHTAVTELGYSRLAESNPRAEDQQ